MRISFRSFIALAVVASLSLAACGGGGGGGSPMTMDPPMDMDPPPTLTPLETFTGTYAVNGYAGVEMPTPGGTAFFGSRDADGAGDLSGGSVTFNNDGTVSTSTPLAEVVAIGSDFAVDIDSRLFGGMAQDGSIMIVAGGADGEEPEMRTYVKRGTGFTDASLTGIWRIAAAGRDTVPGSLWGDYTFDGMGGFTASLSQAGSGSVVGPIATSGTYAVAADGSFTISTTSPTSFVQTGQIRADGQGLALSGGTAGTFITAGAGVPIGSGLSAASVTGDYWVVGLAAFSGFEQRAYRGSATADGMGGMVLTMESNIDGVTGVTPGTLALAIAADGGVTADGGMEIGMLAGGVNTDASMMVLGGDTATGSPETLLIFIKK